MAQRQFTVGTTAVLLARDRTQRAAINISVLPTSVAAGNTGVVYIGKGFVPTAVIGAPNVGDPLIQGSQFTESASFDGDPAVFNGQYWAISDTAGQILVVDEVIADVSSKA